MELTESWKREIAEMIIGEEQRLSAFEYAMEATNEYKFAVWDTLDVVGVSPKERKEIRKIIDEIKQGR